MKKKLLLAFSLGMAINSLALGAGSSPLNINTADQSVLAAVSGIGKHKAEAIVEYRQAHGPFKDIHDLIKVKGFTEKNLQNLLKRHPGELVMNN